MKMLLDKPYGLLKTSLNLNVIILVVSFKQNLIFKIQMLVGNSLISFLNSRSEEILTLVTDLVQICDCYLKKGTDYSKVSIT